MTEDFGALESPAAEASPPKLQILCLAALSKEVNSSFPLGDTGDFLK